MALPAHFGYNFTATLHKDINPSTDPTKSDLDQSSKVVLITGAGRGIGRSIALQYAACNVATLIICARSANELDATEQSIHKVNPSVKTRKVPLDISNNEQVVAAAAKITNEERRLDALINNAGTTDEWIPIADGNPVDYWRTWEVSIKGTYQMTRAFLPLLTETAKKQERLVDIVNVSSIGAHTMHPGASSYQTSRFALLRFTEFVQLEYAEKGVNCFVIHPGGVLTELSKDNAVIRDMLTDTPDLAGGFVVWLTKGQRSWLSGRYLSSSWDVDELEAKKDEIVAGDKLKMRMVV